ncbi:PD-(D/E)XK nuclease family transposase [Massilimicrobiota timonensis]|nr:PD-(D/E)XK nuclease family transposase [Massilimicrobiota timonensis]
MVKMNQEYLEFVKALRPIDDIFMKVIFNDQHCIELLFNIIFEEDISITKWHIQDEYRNLHGRTVIMDIVASTENGNIIDVEMERSLKNASPLRARFHASILDSSLSYVNEKWEKLPEIYVIFICEKDVLETNRLKNHIQRYGEDGEAFEDKVHIIDMNANKEDETPLGKLMHDLRCENHEDMYDEVLKERVRYFKQKEGGKKVMCDMMEKLEKRGEKRGIKIGEMKSLIQILLKKFPGMNFEWVKECNEQQIEKIQDHILMNMSYEEFYKLVLHDK